MFSHQEISRWLSFPIDPITVEDWLANRDVFGHEESDSPESRQLETAYQIEKARISEATQAKDQPLEILLNGLELSGLIDERDYLIVAPSGGLASPNGTPLVALEVYLAIGSERARKLTLPSPDFIVIPLEKNQSVKLKIKCRHGFKINKKREVSWAGTGKSKMIFDTRGRPIATLDGIKQHEIIAKVKQQLLPR